MFEWVDVLGIRLTQAVSVVSFGNNFDGGRQQHWGATEMEISCNALRIL